MLLVSSIDSCHYLYSMAALDQPPLATLTGHRSDSFCVKSCFSPCGQHVLSGSSDRRAYIWDVSACSSSGMGCSRQQQDQPAILLRQTCPVGSVILQ